AINTRETEFSKIVEPKPIMLKAFKPFHVHQNPQNGVPLNGYGLAPQQTISSYMTVPRVPEYEKPSSSQIISPVKEAIKTTKSELIKAPPKKKWIMEYLGK
ncbi:Zinc finger protein, partial [Operophtera brumata]